MTVVCDRQQTKRQFLPAGRFYGGTILSTLTSHAFPRDVCVCLRVRSRWVKDEDQGLVDAELPGIVGKRNVKKTNNNY